MSSPSGLNSVGIIEKDTNTDMMWVWSYPTVDPAFRDLLLEKCTLAKKEGDEGTRNSVTYLYGHILDVWYYFLNSNGSSKLHKVESFSIVIVAKDFNPEKYHHLASIFTQDYLSEGSPVPIVRHYLSVFTRGEISDPPTSCEAYQEKSYNIKHAYLQGSLRAIGESFGIESILLYNALLLKKRVVVYAQDLQTLLDTCRTLPLLVWHRQNWNIVYPDISMDEGELDCLRGLTSYVAGFTDPSIEAHQDLYDLFMNVPANTLTVSPDAKDAFGMTKLHKDIAMKLMECCKNEDYNDQAIVKELSTKTKELLNNLRKLAGEDGKISLEVLHSRKMTPATENFLFSLASVEGLAQR